MKLIGLNIFIIFIAFTSLSLFSKAQEINISDPRRPYQIKKHIGKIKENDYYLVGYEGTIATILKHDKENLVSKTNFLGKIKAGVGRYLIELEYKEWFISNDTLYSLIQKMSEEEVWLQINKYNENVQTIDSLTIFHDSIKDHKTFSFDFKQINNQIGIVGSTNTKEDESFFLTFNLVSSQIKRQYFNLETNKKIQCSDFLFNKNNDFIAVFEGEENLRNNCDKPQPEKFLSFLAVSIDGVFETVNLITNQNELNIKSYKLLPLNENEVIIGALTFSANDGMPMRGYQISKIKFNSNSIYYQHFFDAEKLRDLSIWSEKDVNLFEKDKLNESSYYQSLSEIKLLKDGTYILISEAKYAGCGGASADFSGGPTTMSGGGISSTSGASSVHSRGVSYSNHGSISSIGKLIVSEIETSIKQVKWSAITKNRSGYINPEAYINYTYFLDFNVTQDKMIFYYLENPSNFDDSGFLNEKYISTSAQKENTIAKFEIDLLTGKNKLIELNPPLTEDKRHKISVGSSHLLNDNELLFFTYRTQGNTKLHYQIFKFPR